MQNNNLKFWYITGLIDAEGSFIVTVTEDNSRNLGYNISISLEMGFNHNDKNLLVKSLFKGW